jgi:mannose-6-phosphate isomerase
MNLVDPIFFTPNRVWRCYTGGKLLDEFVGNDVAEDGHFPEDWLASTVRAVNGERSQGPEEGLARVADPEGNPGALLSEMIATHGESLLGPEHIQRFGTDMALLCKYLDSAVRLPIQCHPDVETARQLYSSEYGKTESWHIVNTRRINGEEPYILMGFKEGVTREAFAKAIETQDIATMENMLHKIHVQPGETYFVPARLPHAIGPGVFMVETQEPSDWVIQPERFCADTELSECDMWGPLTPDQGLDVFEYEGLDESELLRRVKMDPMVLHRSDEGYYAEAIGSHHTSAFGVWHVEVVGRMQLELPRPFALVVCVAGEGVMNWANGSCEIEAGQYFLQPYGVPWVEYRAHGRLSLLVCLPPSAES